MPIERTDHLTELVCEAVDASGDRCSECHDVAAGGRLLKYSTVRGARVRAHDGLFCSKVCHDMFHGLAPRKAN